MTLALGGGAADRGLRTAGAYRVRSLARRSHDTSRAPATCRGPETRRPRRGRRASVRPRRRVGHAMGANFGGVPGGGYRVRKEARGSRDTARSRPGLPRRRRRGGVVARVRRRRGGSRRRVRGRRGARRGGGAPRPQAVADRDGRFPGEAPKEPGECDVPEFERPPAPDVDPPARRPRPVVSDETRDGLGAHEGQPGRVPSARRGGVVERLVLSRTPPDCRAGLCHGSCALLS